MKDVSVAPKATAGWRSFDSMPRDGHRTAERIVHASGARSFHLHKDDVVNREYRCPGSMSSPVDEIDKGELSWSQPYILLKTTIKSHHIPLPGCLHLPEPMARASRHPEQVEEKPRTPGPLQPRRHRMFVEWLRSRFTLADLIALIGRIDSRRANRSVSQSWDMID